MEVKQIRVDSDENGYQKVIRLAPRFFFES